MIFKNQLFMKKIITVLSVFLFTFFNRIDAQVYPYFEGFESVPNTTAVNGVNGMSASFNVYAYSGLKKGFNSSAAAQFQMTSFRAKDSLTTPTIGPLTATSQLTFLFRISETGAIATLDHTLIAGDNIEVILVSPLGSLTAYTITSANQYANKYRTPQDSAMYQVKYNVPAIAVGQSGQIRFRVNHFTGAGNQDFMFLLDSIVVKDSTASTNPLAISGTKTDITCFGKNNGTINASASGGTPNYTYNWGAGITGATRSSLGPGSYTVTVTDGASATASNTFTILEPSLLTLAATVDTQVKCFGANTGHAYAIPTGGTAGYIFNWNTSPPKSGAVVSRILAGNYTVTVTDAKSCTATATANVSQPASAVTVNAVVSNATTFGASNGAINITASGGTGTLSYNWGGGITSEDRTALPAGNYCVTVTDINLCTATRCDSVKQPAQGAGVSVTGVVTSVSCKGGNNGAIDITASGGSGSYTYNWGAGITIDDRIALTTGTYVVSVSDGNGQTATQSFFVGEPAVALTTTTQSMASTGSNGKAIVIPSGGTPSYTYVWNTSPTQNTDTAKNLAAGKYRVTVTDSKGCTKVDSVIVVVSGIQDVEKENFGKIYPNPTSGKVTIETSNLSGAVDLQIIDLIGRVVYEEKVSADRSKSIQLDLSALEKGNYILKIQSATKINTAKIILE